MADQEALLIRERELAARELESEKARTALAERETLLERERAEFFRSAMDQLTRGPGFWCRVAKVFTLGLKTC